MEKASSTKNILIAVLSLAIIAMGYFLFHGDSDYKRKVKDLHEENEKLHKEREQIDAQIISLKEDLVKLEAIEDSLAMVIVDKDKEIQKDLEAARKSKAELEAMRRSLDETRKSIDHLRKNPPNRTGDDLLNSLKLKTMK